MTVSLATRRKSFLSESKWLHPPWTSDIFSQNPIQTLTDSTILLPAIMENWDGVVMERQLEEDGILVDVHVFKGFIHDVLKIKRAINDWESNLRGAHDESRLFIPNSSGTELLSDSDNSGKVFPISYTFPTFDIAAAIVYYEAVIIFVNGFLLEMMAYAKGSETYELLSMEGLTTESLESADRICQSLDYFFHKDKRMIGRIVILSPFEAARGLYASLLKRQTESTDELDALVQKLKFCETITERIRDEGLLLWDGTT